MGLSVRLYVGGIPPGITLKELEDRFLPFGSVEQCEIIPPKTHAIVTHGAERQTVSYPRNFGFVSILPKDERSLQRAMSCYNGTRWRGSVMRCQVAKPTMMDKIAAEKINEEKERDEATRSQIMPLIEPETTLRLRRPYTRHLVPVKFEGNKNLHATHLEGGELDDVEKSVVVNEKIPRKRSYEEHLRSLNMVEKTDTAGYPEKEVRVNSTFVDSGKNEKYTFKSTCHPSVSPGKLETDNRRWNAASSGGRDSRIISFMSGDEAEAFQVGRTLVGIDLSRFDSESDNDGETKRATGGRIPQVDGGDDEETSDEDSMDEVAHAEASLPAHKDSQSKDSEKLKQQSSSSEADSESDSEEAALPDDMPDSIPGWLSESLPEGALFHRQEPLHQVEAAWRATKDGELQECKERRRQALRHLQGMTKNGFIGSKRKRSK